ncbi:MAG: hypothetical protein JSV20_09915 [Candidatus Bathyarchaeota archaeon]|nr:MAG: hypothetical protein JSV20_09915 [Candidatus Bathyarchaeota archaeon]
MDRVPTGIDGLDNLLKGGLPPSTAIGLVGDVNSGKEMICNHVTWSLLNKGYYVLYFAVDKSAEDIRDDMYQSNWNIEDFEKEDKLHFIDVFSRGQEIIEEKMYESGELVEPEKISFNFKEMIAEGRKYAIKMALRRRKLVVIYYSMSPLFTVSNHRDVLRFLQYAKYATRISKAVGIAALHLGIHGTNIETAFQQLADGIIEVRRKTLNGYAARFIRISKMARTNFSENYYPLEISKDGILVHTIPVTSM